MHGGIFGMDFFTIKHKPTKNGFDIYPSFRTGGVKDIMVRGKTFYAIWDEEKGIWSTEEKDVVRLVDTELRKAYLEEREKNLDKVVGVKYMDDYSSGSYKEFKKFLKDIYDDYKPLDSKITFASDNVKRNDYVSKRLPYDLSDNPCPSWNELIETLYSPEEREKLNGQ